MCEIWKSMLNIFNKDCKHLRLVCTCIESLLRYKVNWQGYKWKNKWAEINFMFVFLSKIYFCRRRSFSLTVCQSFADRCQRCFPCLADWGLSLSKIPFWIQEENCLQMKSFSGSRWRWHHKNLKQVNTSNIHLPTNIGKN